MVALGELSNAHNVSTHSLRQSENIQTRPIFSQSENIQKYSHTQKSLTLIHLSKVKIFTYKKVSTDSLRQNESIQQYHTQKNITLIHVGKVKIFTHKK